MKNLSRLQDSIDDYLVWLRRARRATPTTCKNYRSTLYSFLEDYKHLNSRNVTGFLSRYESPASANTARTRLRGLGTYLDIPLDRIPRAKEFVKEPEALNSRQISDLIESSKKIHPQLGFSVMFLAFTGLRWHEFLGLTRDSLQYECSVPYLRILGKGRKERTVTLCAKALDAFNHLELPFSMVEKSFRLLLKQAGQAAKLPYHAHPHLLRASCASILINEKRVDSAIVAKMLGWSKVDTLVKHYYKISLDVMHGAIG